MCPAFSSLGSAGFEATRDWTMHGDLGPLASETIALKRISQVCARLVANRVIQIDIALFIRSAFNIFQAWTNAACCWTRQCHIDPIAQVAVLVAVDQK